MRRQRIAEPISILITAATSRTQGRSYSTGQVVGKQADAGISAAIEHIEDNNFLLAEQLTAQYVQFVLQ